MRRGALTLSLLVLGCAPKSTPPAVAPDRPDPCRLVADSSKRLDTLTVALLDSVNLRQGMMPVTDGERLLFRNLFDNLVRVDCEGRPRPGLAGSWALDRGRNAWELTLTPEASFPVAGRASAADAAAIFKIRSYMDSLTTDALGFDSAAVIDDRRLRVFMAHPIEDSVPRFLADPALVLIDGLASSGESGEQSWEISRRGNRPVVEVRFPLSRDPRDALDRDVDLVVTRDPQLVDYVSNRAEFITFPLPWSRTYVLLEAGSTPGLASTLADASARGSLLGAIQGDARVAEPPSWWSDIAECARLEPPAAAPTSRLVYPQGDQVARGLAERIVALSPSRPDLRAVGLEATEFTTALRRGTERGYVLGVPRQSLAPCREVAGWPAGARLFPLVDTRAFAIVRKGAPPLSVEWDGTLRIVDP